MSGEWGNIESSMSSILKQYSSASQAAERLRTQYAGKALEHLGNALTIFGNEVGSLLYRAILKKMQTEGRLINHLVKSGVIPPSSNIGGRVSLNL